jgi:DtxR family Mn-dependent transcriptional regulator
MGTQLEEIVSATMQMYLKKIHEIQLGKGAARVTDIANKLEVKKASVTNALKNLKTKGLINYEPYDVITLTGAGLEVVDQIENRYEALKLFFTDVLGIKETKAELEACELEHHLSTDIYDRLVHFVDFYVNQESGNVRWDVVQKRFIQLN